MKTVVLTCKTLEDEINFAIEKTGISYPVEWLESGLHNTPKKLYARIQEYLDSVEADRVLVAMGFCGNSVLGLRTRNFELIIPRVDDCITLLLGSMRTRTKISQEHKAYFMTEGWMRGERNLWVEYKYMVDKYGEEQAKSISEMMFGHYRTLGLLDVGTKPIEPLLQSTRIIADTLNLKQKVFAASVAYIEQLLTGPWPEDRFLIKAPNEEIKAEDLCLPM